MGAPLQFQVIHKVHQKTRRTTLECTLAEIEGTAESWLWKALEFASTTSKTKEYFRNEISAPLRLFRDLSTLKEWQQLATLPPHAITMEHIVAIFELIEDATERVPSWSPDTRAASSSYTRSIVLRYFKAWGLPRIENIRTRFKSRLQPHAPSHRRLISDLPSPADSEPIHPVGAIPHRSLEALKEATRAALQGVLDQICDCAISELDLVDAARPRFDAFLAERADDGLIRMLQVAAQQRSTNIPRQLRKASIQSVARACLELRHRYAAEGFRLPRGTEVADYLGQRLGRPRAQLPIVFFPLGTQMRPVLACLLLLQRHTGWNVNVVLELTTQGLSSRKPPLELQSFKTRVGKPSSIVLVETKDTHVIRALDFLHERLELMKSYGWLSPNETRLWLADGSARSGRAAPYANWGHELHKFQDAHGLPKFSLEQMRTQVLCLRGETGGIEAMRDLANHKSIATTGGYAYQLLLYRKNEAINLEFQRRLEREISYRSDGDATPALLRPIGDGTSCANPEHPPLDDYLKNGVCNAVACHVDGGCPNRRIEISKSRIEEAVRTSEYYRHNWIRLLEANRAEFERFHLSSMVFNHGLLSVLEAGPYRDFLASARTRVAEEIAAHA